MSYTAKEVESFYYVAGHLESQARHYMQAAELVNAIADKMAQDMVRDASPTAAEKP